MATKKNCAPDGMTKGGLVKVREVGQIKGVPMSPLTKAKMNNGIPGYKKGGKIKDCKC